MTPLSLLLLRAGSSRPSRLPRLLFSFPARFLSTTNPNPTSTSDRPTSASFDRLIKEAGQQRDFAALKSLLEDRIRAGCFNTTRTFDFVSQNPTSLLPPTIDSVSSLAPGFGQKNSFDSLIANLCKSDHIELTRHVIDQMPHCLSVITFYPILSILARKKRMDEVASTLASMKQRSIPPDATCYNYIISAHCHVGDLSAAAETLTTMLRDGLVPDSLTFDSLVLGACRVGRFDAAMALMRRMAEDRVKVLYCTYSHVIIGLLGIGAYSMAVEFVAAIGGRDRRLDAENFGILARGLLRRKRWEEFRVVLKEIQERDLEIEGLNDINNSNSTET